MKKNKNSQRGFTLMETLVSILLLAIILAGGMGFYFNSKAIMVRAMHKKIALEIANYNMEQLRSFDYAYVGSLTHPCLPSPNPSVGGLTATCTIQVAVVSGSLASGYKQIDVHVTWNEPGKVTLGRVDLVSYMTGP